MFYCIVASTHTTDLLGFFFPICRLSNLFQIYIVLRASMMLCMASSFRLRLERSRINGLLIHLFPVIVTNFSSFLVFPSNALQLVELGDTKRKDEKEKEKQNYRSQILGCLYQLLCWLILTLLCNQMRRHSSKRINFILRLVLSYTS